MSKNYNNPEFAFKHVDTYTQTWRDEFMVRLKGARSRLFFGLFALTALTIGVQGVNKTALRNHPARPPVQAIAYLALAGTGIWLTDLIRVRKETSRGWEVMQEMNITNREDLTQRMAERTYMPYANDSEMDIEGNGLSHE